MGIWRRALGVLCFKPRTNPTGFASVNVLDQHEKYSEEPQRIVRNFNGGVCFRQEGEGSASNPSSQYPGKDLTSVYGDQHTEPSVPQLIQYGTTISDRPSETDLVTLHQLQSENFFPNQGISYRYVNIFDTSVIPHPTLSTLDGPQDTGPVPIRWKKYSRKTIQYFTFLVKHFGLTESERGIMKRNGNWVVERRFSGTPDKVWLKCASLKEAQLTYDACLHHCNDKEFKEYKFEESPGLLGESLYKKIVKLDKRQRCDLVKKIARKYAKDHASTNIR